MSRPTGRFALVLHSHLPYVLRHGRWPHGTDWLCEAVAESYLPLLRTLERLERDGVPAKVTISFTPILSEQLADAGFRTEFQTWIAARRAQLERDGREAGGERLHALVRQWTSWIDETERQFHALDGNILAAFRGLEERGRIEIATSAASHGYLPLLSREESVTLQFRAAVAAHTRHFGRAPRGVWLPECAYRPGYEWTPPIGRDSGRTRTLRRGIEEHLAEHGLKWFVIDAHVANAGDPLSIYRNFYPSLAALRGYEERFPQHPRTRTAGRAYHVKSRNGAAPTVALVRDGRTSLQVWSRDEGYPGHPDYLDFHRRSIANGVRYHRVTGAVADKDKHLYDVELAAARTEEHARHFAWLVGDTLERLRSTGVASPLVVSPFDTELFGHWWFEGPVFLEHVFRHLADSGIASVTASEEVDAPGTREEISLLEGSWGEGGDHRAWLNKHTEWTWDRLYDAEADVHQTLAELRRGGAQDPPPLAERALRQALRELLLMQSSDWQFLITTGAARDYAERRLATHYVELKRLLDVARRVVAGGEQDSEADDYLSVMEKRDRCFPEIESSWFA